MSGHFHVSSITSMETPMEARGGQHYACGIFRENRPHCQRSERYLHTFMERSSSDFLNEKEYFSSDYHGGSHFCASMYFRRNLDVFGFKNGSTTCLLCSTRQDLGCSIYKASYCPTDSSVRQPSRLTYRNQSWGASPGCKPSARRQTW